ncbi:hypothetical protein FMUND_12755 [Fusarium mundagurra]|uniref:Uncharacterized protein n=1 Tax=Fusarium mundagurra TaxID=1567541 RepID=A0A8H5Y2I0_9HYPO|nr:hypothetical protein FMUND_12755 [Fusarium mundagurra]
MRFQWKDKKGIIWSVDDVTFKPGWDLDRAEFEAKLAYDTYWGSESEQYIHLGTSPTQTPSLPKLLGLLVRTSSLMMQFVAQLPSSQRRLLFVFSPRTNGFANLQRVTQPESFGIDTSHRTAGKADHTLAKFLNGITARKFEETHPTHVPGSISKFARGIAKGNPKEWPDGMHAWREKLNDPDAFAVNIVKHKKAISQLMEHAVSRIDLAIGTPVALVEFAHHTTHNKNRIFRPAKPSSPGIHVTGTEARFRSEDLKPLKPLKLSEDSRLSVSAWSLVFCHLTGPQYLLSLAEHPMPRKREPQRSPRTKEKAEAREKGESACLTVTVAKGSALRLQWKDIKETIEGIEKATF